MVNTTAMTVVAAATEQHKQPGALALTDHGLGLDPDIPRIVPGRCALVYSVCTDTSVFSRTPQFTIAEYTVLLQLLISSTVKYEDAHELGPRL